MHIPRRTRASSTTGFFPLTAGRSFDEIDPLQLGEYGIGNLVSAEAEIDFLSGPAAVRRYEGAVGRRRTDIGPGDIPPERCDVDFFSYRPPHLGAQGGVGAVRPWPFVPGGSPQAHKPSF